ncbi:MAG: hypothetical protein DRO88_07265 [Promethearchaeia archaeon]|nr:MAG: hypothetical protein DRO88_07265 [Candidatus Lokiarchaeia archaeon]
MKHIRLRSFPTKCRYCGKSILYWESTRGAKVFFNLPIYGKPIRHQCSARYSRKKAYQVKETVEDHLKKKLEHISFQCPVCGKIYHSETALNSHFKQMRRYDDHHAEFYDMLEFLVVDDESKDHAHQPSQSFKTHHKIETVQDRFIFRNRRKGEKNNNKAHLKKK